MVKSEDLIRVSLLALLTSLLPIPGLAAGLDTLRLQPNERIVIVAPHPDDEVLACGGLIQQALALGDSVWVVYVTSGDGSWPSAWRVTGNLLPGPKDYLDLGRARMNEARAGAGILGLDTSHLVFLGYPDGELDRLMFEPGDGEQPVTSSHTRVDYTPYVSHGHLYHGDQVIDGLLEQVARHHADRVFFPHPLDVHPDHWAVGAALATVKELWHLTQKREFPAAYYYVVHRPGYPSLNKNGLAPPAGLTGAEHHWYTLPITAQEAAVKQDALGSHWSQFTELGSDLSSYVADNEVFELAGDDSGTARGDAPAVGFMPIPRIDSLTASVPRGLPKVFKLYLSRAPGSGFDCRLYGWPFWPMQDGHVIELRQDSSSLARLLAGLAPSDSTSLATAASFITDPICVRAGDTWTIYLPAYWWDAYDRVLFTADIRWGGRLINHTSLGSVVREKRR